MLHIKKQPIIILGGFLINSYAYKQMADCLKNKTISEVLIININKIDWLLTIWSFGWRRILDRLDNEVNILKEISPTGKVTLIGHSSGGIMLRLYLSDKLFAGKTYNGANKCNCLITLGSPHQAKKATKLRAMVDRKYPGCFYSHKVKYISIAGKLDLDSDHITNFSKRSAKSSYESITGQNINQGDGLVPIESALLDGSTKITINETAHAKLFGKYWYGSTERVNEWWNLINN